MSFPCFLELRELEISSIREKELATSPEEAIPLAQNETSSLAAVFILGSQGERFGINWDFQIDFFFDQESMVRTRPRRELPHRSRC